MSLKIGNDNFSPCSSTEELVGKGGFGIVFKAINQLDNKTYAIKRIPVDRAYREYNGDIDKLFREVKILAELEHANIVRYYNCWLMGPNIVNGKIEEDYDFQTTFDVNFFFIQLELCDSSLKDLITSFKSKTLTVTDQEYYDQVPDICIQVSCGLSYLHSKRITHRDIKPSNILKKSKLWKICDFGLSVSQWGESKGKDFSVAGTPAYKSPDERDSQKSDMYSLGLTLMELLDLGFTPLSPQIKKNYKFNKTLIPSDLHSFHDVIMEMLDLNPDERPSSMEALEEFQSLIHAENELPIRKKIIKPKLKVNPFWFNVPRNVGNFSGRKKELDFLQNTFQSHVLEYEEEIENSDKSNVAIVPIIGLGGVGKSELMKKFCFQLFISNEANTIWLNADSNESFSNSMQKLSQKVDASPNSTTATESFLNILKVLPQLPTILHLDNVDEICSLVEEFIQGFYRLDPSFSMLLPMICITSRNRGLMDRLNTEKVIELDVLEQIASLDLLFLSGIVEEDKKDDAIELTELLQHFPLALQQAVGYIRHRRQLKKGSRTAAYSIRDYLELFQKQKKKMELLNHQLSLEHHYAKTTVTTWALNFEYIVSHEELGTLAKDIILIFGFCLDPNGEEISPLVSFLEAILNQGTENENSLDEENMANLPLDNKGRLQWLGMVQPSSFNWAPRGLKEGGKYYGGFHGPTEAKIELEDDERSSADVIRLIMSLSLAAIKLQCDEKGRDIEFITMHRLVQEIIRGRHNESESKANINELLNSMSKIKFREWSKISVLNFKRRVSSLDTLFGYSHQYQGVASSFAKLVLKLWEDSVSGYVPKLREELLQICIEKTSSSSELPIEVLVVVQKYFWNIKFGSNKYSKDLSFTEKILTFYQNQSPVLLQKDHRLYYEVTGLVLQFIFKDMLPKDSHALLISTLKIILDHVITLFDSLFEKLNYNYWFTLLCLTGRICQYIETYGEFEEFCRTFLKSFETKNLNLEKYHCIFILLLNEAKLTYPEYSESLQKELKAILTEFKNQNPVRFAEMNTIFTAPPPAMAYLIMDQIAQFPPETTSGMSIISLDQLCQFLKSSQRQDCCQKILDAVKRSCVNEKYEVARELITIARKLENILWEEGYFNECQSIMRDYVLTLAKYSKCFCPSEIITRWIDEFVQRMSSQIEQIGQPLALKATTTEDNEISKDVQSLNIFQHFSSDIDQEAEVLDVSRMQLLSRNGNLNLWIDETKNILQKLESSELKYYFEAKLAENIPQGMFSIEMNLSSVSMEDIAWSLGFVLRHSFRLNKLKGRLLKNFLQAMESVCSQSSLLDAQLEEMSRTIVQIEDSEDSYHNSNIQTFWFLIYGLIIVSEREGNLCNFANIFSLKDDDQDFWFECIVTRLRKFIEKTDSSSTRLLHYVLPRLLHLFLKLPLDHSDIDVHLPFIRIYDIFIKDNWNYGLFSDVVLMSHSLLESCIQLLNQPQCNDADFLQFLQKKYSLPEICNRSSLLSDIRGNLKCYHLLLHYLHIPDKQIMVAQELNSLVEKVKEFPHSMEQLFLFLVKHKGFYDEVSGPDAEQLLDIILEQLYDKEQFLSIYRFGLRISLFSQGIGCTDETEVILKKVCEVLERAFKKDASRVKRVLEAGVIGNPNNISSFKEGNLEAFEFYQGLMRTLLEKYHVEDLGETLLVLNSDMNGGEDIRMYRLIDEDYLDLVGEQMQLELD